MDICRQIALGMADLHKHRLVHLDLKPDNVMIDVFQTGEVRAKVSDLGCAVPLRPDDTVRFYSRGTKRYLSPEAAGTGEREGDTKMDVWSFGVLLTELHCPPGVKLPIKPTGWPEFVEGECSFAPGTPPIVQRLAIACLRLDPIERPTFEDIADKLAALLSSSRSRSRFPLSPAESTWLTGLQFYDAPPLAGDMFLPGRTHGSSASLSSLSSLPTAPPPMLKARWKGRVVCVWLAPGGSAPDKPSLEFVPVPTPRSGSEARSAYMPASPGVLTELKHPHLLSVLGQCEWPQRPSHVTLASPGRSLIFGGTCLPPLNLFEPCT